MAETQTWRAGPIRRAYREAPVTDGGQSRRRRAGTRLWALLHAPASLRGAAADRRDVTFIEDDYRRLAGRRAR
jgi:hypothetical protein